MTEWGAMTGDRVWRSCRAALSPRCASPLWVVRCRLSRVYARVFEMHRCDCGLNVGSWKALIRTLLNKLEDEAEVSSMMVPDRHSSREISWDTLRESARAHEQSITGRNS